MESPTNPPARCPICRAPEPAPTVERHGDFVLRWCARCDVQFADPLREPGQDFYETHRRYSGPELLYTSPWTLHWDQRCFLRDRPRADGRLLDVGCGTGYFAAAASRAGYRVAGLDLSRPQLEIARRSFGLDDVHALTLAEYGRTVPAGSFDVVTAFQVLEHVADPMSFLREATRLLAPGGYCAVGVPNWRVWPIFREALDHPPNHLTRWSRTALARALEGAGLEVVRIREFRSAYSFFLRHLRCGLLRRSMERSSRAAATALEPNSTVLTLSIAKTRLLMALDLPARAVFTALGVPGSLLYGLARRGA